MKVAGDHVPSSGGNPQLLALSDSPDTQPIIKISKLVYGSDFNDTCSKKQH